MLTDLVLLTLCCVKIQYVVNRPWFCCAKSNILYDNFHISSANYHHHRVVIIVIVVLCLPIYPQF